MACGIPTKMPKHSRQAFVERILRSQKASARNVHLRVSAPRPSPNGDWECSYELVGLKASKPQTVCGFDGLQALLMAIEGARIAIEKSAEPLTWADVEPSYHSLPHFVPTAFGLAFAKRIAALIDKEIERAYFPSARSRRQSAERHPGHRRRT